MGKYDCISVKPFRYYIIGVTRLNKHFSDTPLLNIRAIRTDNRHLSPGNTLFYSRCILLPHQYILLPHQYTLLPQQYNLIPHQYTLLPQQYNLLPQQYNLLPQQYYLLPQQYNLIPQQSILLSHQWILFSSHWTLFPLQRILFILQRTEIWLQGVEIIPHRLLYYFKQLLLSIGLKHLTEMRGEINLRLCKACNVRLLNEQSPFKVPWHAPPHEHQ